MAIDKEINIKVNTSDATTSLKTFNKEVDSTKEKAGQSNEAINSMAGSSIGKIQGLTKTLGSVATGFKSIGTAIALSGIGLLVITIGAVAQAFKGSEEGQNKFAKIMGVIGSIMGNVTDLISDFGELVIGIFSGDSKAIKAVTSFGKKLWDVVGLPIKNIITTVQTLSKVLGALFSGDVKGAFDELKNGVENIKGNFNDAKNSINEATTSLKAFGKEALEEARIAQQIADMRAIADKSERDLIVKRAEADRKIAQLREDATKKDTFNSSQRIAMLKEAQAIESNLTNQEITNAKKRADAKTKENKLSKSTKEDLMEEEQLKAKVIQLETERLQGNRRLTSAIQGLNAELRADEQARLAEKKTERDLEFKEAFDFAVKMADLGRTIEAEKKATAERIAAEDDAEEKAQFDKEIANLVKLAAEKKALQQQELDATRAFESAKFQIVDQTLSLISALAGESKAVATALLIVEKGLAISQVVTSASRSIAQATANLAATPAVVGVVPNPAYAIQAAATVKGIATTKISAGLAIGNILAQTIGKLSGSGNLGGSSSSGGSGGGQAPSAPSFNLVGGTGINQIAQGLAGQQQPLQAYVVSGNVTSAQSLDRNIVNTASVG